MTPLDPAEIGELADAFEEELMPNTATILKRQSGSDGQGGKEVTWKPRAENVPCGFGPLKQRGAEAETPIAGRPSAMNRWVFRMPAGTTVHATDRIEVDGDPRVFEVEQLRGPRGSYTFMTRFEATVADDGGKAE